MIKIIFFRKRDFVKIEVLNKFKSNLKAILKCKNHPSIIAIQNTFKDREMRFTSEISKKIKLKNFFFYRLNTSNRILNILVFPPKSLRHGIYNNNIKWHIN